MASEDKTAWVNQRLESHRRAQQVSAASEATPSYRSRELLGAVEDTVTVLGEKETPGEPKLLWVGDLGYEVTDELLKAAFTQVRLLDHTKSPSLSLTALLTLIPRLTPVAYS